MPYQTLGNTRIVDKVLTRVAYGFRQLGFVGDLVFPLAPVSKRKGKILTFGREEFFLHEMSRMPGANIRQISSEYGSTDYELKQDAIAEKIPFEYIEEASDLPINLTTRATTMVMRRLALRLEADRMALAGNINSYPVTNRSILAGVSQWSDPTSNPEQAIDTAIEVILDGCGMAPNVGIASLKAFNALKRHPLVRDKYKYTNANSITKEMVAKAFNLSRLEISAAKYILPSTPGTLAPVFNNSFWMGYIAGETDSPINCNPLPRPNSSIDSPSFGYTYQLENYPNIAQPYYDRSCHSWVIDGIAERKPVIAFPTAGFLFANVAA